MFVSTVKKYIKFLTSWLKGISYSTVHNDSSSDKDVFFTTFTLLVE